MDGQIAIDPELQKCVDCLSIIDEFRVSKEPMLIDELMITWNQDAASSEPTSSSACSVDLPIHYNYQAQQDQQASIVVRPNQIGYGWKSQLPTILE